MAGRRNAYRVPEGYFGDFHARMMSALPERKADTVLIGRPQHRNTWRMAVGIAACLCAAIGGVAVYMSKIDVGSMQEQQLSAIVNAEPSANATSYEDEFTDYAMMDNMQIYAYMAGE